MPVRIFIPKVPQNEDEFTTFIRKFCSPTNIRIAKNKDGSSFCIIVLNYNENARCANDIIKDLTGKVIGEIVMKPRIYVDQSLMCKLSVNTNVKENPDDIVNTTHFQDGFYYVQLLSEKDTNILMTSHLRDLYDEYKSGKVSPVKHDDLIVNQLYATFYIDEHQFYRVRILAKVTSSEIKVEFIDYGNEEVFRNQIFVNISDKLAKILPMVHKCTITDIIIKSYGKQEIVAKEILHRNYRAKLVKKRDENLNADRVVSLDYLDFTSISYRSFLIIEDIADEIKSNGHASDGINGFKEDESIIVLTHFESLDEFYVQPLSKHVNDNLTNLSNMIADFIEEVDVDAQYIGQEHMYVSQFSQDANWYRCRVIDDRFETLQANCVVQYIDFGNSEIKWSKTELKPLIAKYGKGAIELSEMAPCATKCKFSDDLIYALSKAKMEKDYFHQNFVLSETAVTFRYCIDHSNKVWIVENIVMPNKEEILTIVMKQCENTEKTDIYRLTNLESLDKIWFRLVKSVDPTLQEYVSAIDAWTKEQNIKDLEPARQVSLNQVYCCKMANGNLVRCCILGKNKQNIIVQTLDMGSYESVPIDKIYHLGNSIASIPSMAKSYKLEFSVICTEEHQIEDKISQILGNSNVELVMINEKSIRDVIIKEKSLVQCLAQLDFIQPNIIGGLKIEKENGDRDVENMQDENMRKMLDNGESATDTDEGVDFTLPSVENMAEVPLEIAIYNSHVRSMRKLFSINTSNLFEDLFKVIENCDNLNELIDCCNQVFDLSHSMESLNTEFVNLATNIKTKLKDFDPLIDKRKEICEKICELHKTLIGSLETTSSEKLEFIKNFTKKNFVSVNNLMEIFKLSVDKCFAVDVDIKTIQARITEFQSSELYANLVKQFSEKAKSTDDLVLKYKSMLESMYKEYDLGEVLPNTQTTAIPLIDSTYELHLALKSECQHFMANFQLDDVIQKFDVINLTLNFYFYLQQQIASVETIIEKIVKLQTLNDQATLILNDDSQVYKKIENNHKRIIGFRSTLKHNVADMEDAEEQDDKEKIDEICGKIDDTRKCLHEALKASKDIIDKDVEKLMIRKPELQIKNQSIFFCEEGIPIFLWDSIFFDIPPRCDSFSDFFNTKFGNEIVNMKKLTLNSGNVKNVLRNLTTYSTKINQPTESLVTLLPISYAFLSRSEKNIVYLILPNFCGAPPPHQLPDHFRNNLASIVAFFKSLIDQILDLWHSGFTYSDEDLVNGLFVTSSTLSSSNNPDKVFLPLPLNSIVNRENMNHKCESVQVYFSKLGALLEQSLDNCAEPVNVNCPAVQQLVGDLSNCNGVQEAERVFWMLDQFLNESKNTGNHDHVPDDNESDRLILLDKEQPINNNDDLDLSLSSSSTENIDQSSDSKSSRVVEDEEGEEGDGEQEPSHDLSVTEQVLEIYSNVE